MQLGGFLVMVNAGFLLRRIHRRDTERAEFEEFLNQKFFTPRSPRPGGANSEICFTGTPEALQL
jgi:hypothetical protein